MPNPELANETQPNQYIPPEERIAVAIRNIGAVVTTGSFGLWTELQSSSLVTIGLKGLIPLGVGEIFTIATRHPLS